MNLSRRRFLFAGAATLASAAGTACWDQQNRVTVARHTLGQPDTARPPLRLVQLSDLHLHEVGELETSVAERVAEIQPDLIVVTGDAIDRAGSLVVLDSFLSLLPPETPKFATLGNWEHWAEVDVDQLAEVYASRGGRLLVNQVFLAEQDGRRLLITGLDDATAGKPDLVGALAGVEIPDNHVVLAHSPIYRDEMISGAGRTGDMAAGEDLPTPDCILSGHTHGGQVQALGWAPLRPPGSGKYVEGWYRDAVPHLYVSRGIGTSVLPFRIGAPPEIALFEWHLA